MAEHYAWCMQLRTLNSDDCSCYQDEREIAAEERDDTYERHRAEVEEWGP